MIDFERDELRRNPEWRRVLEAYCGGAKSHSDAEGWMRRVETVDGIADEQLSRIHGRLIALGLLKFQLTGRDAGVCYKLSTRAERVLVHAPNCTQERLSGSDAQAGVGRGR